MKKFLDRFVRDDKGAISVDWVVITAAVVGLCIGLTTLIGSTATTSAENTRTDMVKVVD